MADDDLEDKDSKTEEPTARRLEQALEKGNVVNSREVMNFTVLLCLTLIMIFFVPIFCKKLIKILSSIVEFAHEINIRSQGGVGGILVHEFNMLILITIPMILFLMAALIFASFIQKGEFIFSFEQLKPDLSKISIIKGLERLFSMKSFMEFFKGILKVIIVGAIIYFVVYDDITIMALYHEMSVGAIIYQLYKVIIDMLISVTIIMFLIAIADFMYQKYEYMKNLMMSRYDLKQEYKQTEGSPEIKRKQRKLMMQMSQRDMLTKVPDADVIITNPEHYAIALKYDPTDMGAPIVVAKGVDFLAKKIRDIAEKNDVPIVRDPPLARSLYLVDLNQEIQIEHYETVAKIISYVFKKKNKEL